MSAASADGAQAAFRQQFPGLAESVHLASCSQGAMSTELMAGCTELLESMRSDGAPWDRWIDTVERARAGFAQLIGADASEVAVVSCASEGAYQVASTQRYAERRTVVCTDMEFPSVAHVWLAQRPRGAQVRHVAQRDGTVPAEDIVAAVDEETALVSCPLVSYRNGARLPVREATARAREMGAKVFVDAYQGVGVLPVDVRELDCDYLVAGSVKYLLGLPGIAFLYVRGGLRDDVPVQLTGWFGRLDPFAFDPRTLDHPKDARRFEVGTPSVPSAYGAVAGMRVLSTVPPKTVEQAVSELVDELSDRLLAAGEQLWSPGEPSARGPMVALVDDDPTRLGGWLARRGIVTSPRGHVLRLALHYYNDHSDIDAFCRALAEYRRAG